MTVEIKGDVNAFFRIDGRTITVTKETKPETLGAFLEPPPKKAKQDV